MHNSAIFTFIMTSMGSNALSVCTQWKFYAKGSARWLLCMLSCKRKLLIIYWGLQSCWLTSS